MSNKLKISGIGNLLEKKSLLTERQEYQRLSPSTAFPIRTIISQPLWFTFVTTDGQEWGQAPAQEVPLFLLKDKTRDSPSNLL